MDEFIIEEIRKDFKKYLEKSISILYSEEEVLEQNCFPCLIKRRKEMVSEVIKPITIDLLENEKMFFEGRLKDRLLDLYEKQREFALRFVGRRKGPLKLVKRAAPYLTGAALVASSYITWLRYKSRVCNILRGKRKIRCLIRGCNLMIRSLKRTLGKAERTRFPMKTRIYIAGEIDKWEERKKLLRERL